jgi:signal transduction histidine kinase/DNA-binding response OmpR family regulator/HPt (histidine-containing phosphotransfer) domain-containing protein
MTALLVTVALLLVAAAIGLWARRAWVRRLDELGAVARRGADGELALRAQVASLTESRDRAVADLAAKSGFLAAMSHEIRTPMNGVVGMLGLLTETHLDGKQREFVRTATTSATALLTIIDDILDFSKIEAGKLALERIDFEVRSTIEDAAELLSELASAKGIELSCLIHREVPEYLTGDPARLRQVLLNLGANAIKFTATGAVRIEVQVDIERPAGVALRFEVTDSGIGISEPAQQRLFEPFSQADASTSRRFGGSGLGLSICRGLVELMGGRIGVSSSEGKGSTFWFTAELTRAAPRPAEVPMPATTTRVLVIDPSEVNGEIYRSYLEPRGVDLTLVPTVAMARRRLDAAAGVVLVDSAIPTEDRLQFGRLVRNDPRLAGARLVLVEPLHHQRSPGDGEVFAGFLTKPIRRRALLELLSPPAVPTEGANLATQRRSDALDPRRPGRVLVAEDNEINQLLVVEILAKAGIDAEVACNGAEAVEARFKGTFDVVLMDCQMPVMDGLVATRAIRAREARDRRPAIPIIALTANAAAGNREQCLAAGMSDYLAKPFAPPALLAAVAQWGGGDPAAEGAPTFGATPNGSQPSSSEETPIDLVQFTDVVGTDPEKVRRFLTMYRDGAAAAVHGIAAALPSSNGDAVRRLAHKLRGAAGMIGARRVAGVAGEIEQAAGGGAAAVGPLFDELRAAVAAADAFAVEHWRQID